MSKKKSAPKPKQPLPQQPPSTVRLTLPYVRILDDTRHGCPSSTPTRPDK